MTDISSHPPRARRSRAAERFEYRVYFALLFGISLPTALLRSLRPAPPGLPRRGAIAEAASMAHSAAPYLFKP